MNTQVQQQGDMFSILVSVKTKEGTEHNEIMLGREDTETLLEQLARALWPLGNNEGHL